MPAAEIRPGQIIELSIDNVAHGGRFVGRHGAVEGQDGQAQRGRVVFVPDTMPGETVRAQVVEVTVSYTHLPSPRDPKTSRMPSSA